MLFYKEISRIEIPKPHGWGAKKRHTDDIRRCVESGTRLEIFLE